MAERTQTLADTIVEGLYNGVPLRQLCRDHGISKSAVYRWFDEDAELSGRIAHAREHGYHEIADQCVEIADDKEEDPASRRVRVDTRLKLLAKWSPKSYGDKLGVEHTLDGDLATMIAERRAKVAAIGGE